LGRDWLHFFLQSVKIWNSIRQSGSFRHRKWTNVSEDLPQRKCTNSI